jgi:glycerophosphoryl diester phosphodiesterase
VRRAGYQVNVWTVNNVKLMRRLIKIGVDGIITDVPDVLRGVIEESKTASQRRTAKRET